MGNIFTITNDIREIAQGAIDDLINELGKTCQVVYPPKRVFCANCVYDPIGQKSSNKYKSGGSMPFSFGTCPMCNGAGYHNESATDNITLLCAWQPQNWFILPQNIRVPAGDLQTKGFITDLPKVIACIEMIVELPVEPYIRCKFRLASQPVDPGNIIQNRYFVATWERIG